jgi:hypothetical protein
MIVCPNCQQKEPSGALFCTNCGAQLVEAAKPTTQNIPHIPTDRLGDRPATDRLPYMPPPSSLEAAISLYLMDSGQLIPLTGREEFTLGRASEGQPILPDIDLTPYRAYEHGVSRMHLCLKTGGDKMSATDLGSVNGTRINGQKIPTQTPTPVSNGDIITLGKLKIQLIIRP